MRTWNLSTGILRSVAACFCTSLAAAALAAPGDPPAQPLATELEARLAGSPSIYLVVDVVRRVVDIKARAVLLDRIVLHGVEVVAHRPFFSPRHAATLELPTVWTVTNGPGDTDREIIAPPVLRPYSSGDDEEEKEPVPATPTPRPTGPQPTPTPVPEPPVSYRARMDSGWDLLVTDALPPQGLVARFAAAVRDGWRRLRGEAPPPPPALALAMAREDAQRLHHLARSGMKILLVAAP